MKHWLLGIDYGLEGACAVMEGEGASLRSAVSSMALVHVVDLYKTNEKDLPPQIPIADLRGSVAYVEDFLLRWANTAARDAAIRYGMLLENLRNRGAVIHRVRAHAWKRAVGLPTSDDQKERKKMAFELAKKLFPHARFDRPDQAESALIARYGVLHQGGQLDVAS